MIGKKVHEFFRTAITLNSLDSNYRTSLFILNFFRITSVTIYLNKFNVHAISFRVMFAYLLKKNSCNIL